MSGSLHRAPGPIRHRALALATILAGWFVLAAPIFAGGSFWRGDQALLLYPMRLYLRERLLRGEVPLWMPHLGVGRPFFAWILPATLDPLNALLLLPTPFGQDLYNAIHWAIAGLGAFGWLRALGRSRAAATFGALTLAYGSVFVSAGDSVGPYLWGNAFAPFALWLLAAVRPHDPPTSRARQVLGLAVCLAQMVFSGDPMSVWFVALLGAAHVADAGGDRARGGAVLLGGAAAAALLAAVQLLPAADLARVHRLGGVDVAAAARFALAPVRLLELIAAGPWGAPDGPRWMPTLQAVGAEEPFITSAYLGAATLPLAALGVARGRRGFAAVAALALVLALGRHTPVYAAWCTLAPPARYFRYAEKHLLLLVLALAPLVSAGVDVALAAPRRCARGALALAAGVAAVGATLAAVWHAAPEAGFAVARTAAVILGGAVALALAARQGRAHDVGRAALVLLGAADLLDAGVKVIATAPGWIYTRPSRVVRHVTRDPGGGAPVRVLRPPDGPRTVRAMTPEVYWDALIPNAGTWHGVAHVASYETERVPAWGALTAALRRDPLRLWRLSGARFTVQPTEALRGVPPSWVVGTMRQHGLSLLRVVDPAPRVYLARRSVAADSYAQAVAAVASAPFDVARDVVVEGGASGLAEGRCALVRDAVETLTLRCDTATGGWAVVTDAFADGWTASVQGVPARLHRANAIHRAVWVPAGSREVVMRYAPSGLRAGAWISAVAWAACLVALLATRARRATRGLVGARATGDADGAPSASTRVE